MAELGMAEDLDVIDVTPEAAADGAARPTWRPAWRYAWRPPRWLPAALGVGILLWVLGIWWMFSRVGGPDAPPEEAHAPAAEAAASVEAELAVLRAKVDTLAQQASTLTQEREALAKRVAALEARPVGTPAPAASTAAIVPIDLAGGATGYSIPRFAYPRSTDPALATAQVFPGAIPTRATGRATSPASNSVSGSGERYFTNGADRYNCTSFASQAEAQEALTVNAPGDPNRLDMNGNGVACEDITYPPNTPRNTTPITNR